MTRYAAPQDGLPPQTQLHTGRAIFTEAYAVIPRGVMTQIVTSALPGWNDTRAWIIARPLSGFSETFAQLILEIAPNGGSDTPEPDAGVQGVLFVTDGTLTLTLPTATHTLTAGGYAYLPPGLQWSLRATGQTPARLHWIRKLYEPAPGWATPEAFVTNETLIAPQPDARHSRPLGHHPLCRE